MNQGDRRLKVVIAYHFFPHYREGIIKQLRASKSPEYVFVADSIDPGHEVKELDLSQAWIADKFRRARCFVNANWFWQPGLLGQAVSSGAGTWVLLSLPTNISVWTTAVSGRLLGKNVVFWGHGWSKRCGALRGSIRRSFFGLATSVLLYGHRAKALAIEDGFPPDRLHVVYNSLSHSKQVKLRAKAGVGLSIAERSKYFANAQFPTLICSSRLTLQRDLPLAFHAMSKLKREGLETNLLLLGDGPERQQLEALAQGLNLSVCFAGACYDEAKIACLMQLANLTVSPGNIGLTAVHSLTYGVPVITHSDSSHQGPESEAVIDGWNGILFRRGDVNDLARAIREGLSRFSQIDETRERCYEVVDRFYNPAHQAMIIERAVRGEPAIDDGWDEFLSSRIRQAL